MNREQIEHILRAAGSIAGDDEIVVIGSQAILASVEHPPELVTRSMEADIYPRHHPELWSMIDGSIGEGSPFHDTFGYYAQGVEPATAVLPAGWERRLVLLRSPRTQGVTGLCLEPHDLAISKYVAGRGKDLEFTQALATAGIISKGILLERLDQTPLSPELRSIVAARIVRDCG